MIMQDVTMKKINVDQYVRNLKDDRDQLVDLRTRALRGKVFDFLVKTNSKEMAEIEKTSEAPIEQEAESEQAAFALQTCFLALQKVCNCLLAASYRSMHCFCRSDPIG
jgi:CHAD domain-containing protein